MSENSERLMEINGARHFVDAQGDGPELVFLHAGIADSRMWDGVFADFASDHRAVRYDMRGYGQTELNSTPFSYVDDLKGLFEQLEIESAVLIGCSFGSQMAVDYAIEHPECVDALVLTAPVVRGWDWSEEVRNFGAREDELLDAGDIDGAVELNIETWVIGQNRERADVDERLIARVGEMQKRAFEVQLAVPDAEVNFPEWLAIDNLHEVDAPTLIVSGVHDIGDIHQIVTELDVNISGSKHISLMNTAHMIPLERPDAFVSYVRKFLSGLR